MNNDIVGWGMNDDIPPEYENCQVCSAPAIDGEATCGAEYCRHSYWEITPAEIYQDLFYGVG